jgi:predicted Zn-dependent protease
LDRCVLVFATDSQRHQKKISYLVRGPADIQDPIVRKLYDEAVAFLDVKKLVEAERILLEASAIDPKSHDVLNLLANIALFRNEWGMAVKFCSEALRIRPDSCSALLNISIAFRNISA